MFFTVVSIPAPASVSFTVTVLVIFNVWECAPAVVVGKFSLSPVFY